MLLSEYAALTSGKKRLCDDLLQKGIEVSEIEVALAYHGRLKKQAIKDLEKKLKGLQNGS